MLCGRDLRRLRVRSGRSEQEVAEAADVTEADLREYESERRQPSVDVALRIVTALGHRIELVPMLDPVVQGRRLEAVLEVAEALPFQPRPLGKARR